MESNVIVNNSGVPHFVTAVRKFQPVPLHFDKVNLTSLLDAFEHGPIPLR